MTRESLAEIRFVGPTAQRQLKLVKGGALIASGAITYAVTAPKDTVGTRPGARLVVDPFARGVWVAGSF